MRHADEEWSPLRLAYISAFTALHFATYPGVDAKTQQTARCYARGQMGYVMGDNPMEMSYLTGFGTTWPTQVHHRDVACTLDEGVDGKCVEPCAALSHLLFFVRHALLCVQGCEKCVVPTFARHALCCTEA